MWRLSALGFLAILLSAVQLCDHAPNTHHGIVYHDLSQQAVSQDISFEPGDSSVDGWTEDGCEFSKVGWRSSDGVIVFLEINYCKSPAHAQTVLNKLTIKATKVFEKRILTSKDGKKTGERIVVSFSKNLIKRPEMIFWTEGDEIYMVESTSFAHALIFEKKLPNL